MKILQVAFLLLFNYLDSLPKLYVGCHSKTSWFHQPGLDRSFNAHQLGPTHLYSVSSVQQDLHSYVTEYYIHDMEQHELHTAILKY